jgi:hypothetical protein
MAAAMSTIAIATDAWTSVIASATAGTVGLCNRSGTVMLIRVDASLNTSTDAATAAADQLAPGEYRTYALASSDKVAARMIDVGVEGELTLRTP